MASGISPVVIELRVLINVGLLSQVSQVVAALKRFQFHCPVCLKPFYRYHLWWARNGMKALAETLYPPDNMILLLNNTAGLKHY
jgi:hypothetical protein